MDSVAGQTFLNYAYSWGASIVILGTLFKLTHLPGANFFLFLGMGTEVFVFFISAFDRPFDKTTDGMDLTKGEMLAQHEVYTEQQQNINCERMEEVYNEKLQQIKEIILHSSGEEQQQIRNTANAINEIYKIHLQKVSNQLSDIDHISDRMTTLVKNLEELNSIYQRMIEAVKVKY